MKDAGSRFLNYTALRLCDYIVFPITLPLLASGMNLDDANLAACGIAVARARLRVSRSPCWKIFSLASRDERSGLVDRPGW